MLSFNVLDVRIKHFDNILSVYFIHIPAKTPGQVLKTPNTHGNCVSCVEHNNSLHQLPKTNTYDIIQITRDLSQAQRKVAIPMKLPLLVQRTTPVHH